MAQIPTWAIGKNYVVTLIPLSVDTAGTLTAGTSSYGLTSVVDEVDIDTEIDRENIQTMTSRRNNMVVTGLATKVTMTQIVSTQDSHNILSGVFFNDSPSDYCRVTIARGGKTYTFDGVYASHTEKPRRGKTVATLVLDMIDNGTANPNYA